MRADIESIDDLNERFGVVEIQSIFTSNTPALSGYYKLKFGSQIDVLSVVDEYFADPNVEIAEPNYVGFTTVTPNDSHYGLQWAHAKIQSELGWDIQTGDPTVSIAVVDTGVDWNHTDLAANIWTNPNETINGLDDDGNGYIDDVRGWDFVDTNDPVWPGEDGMVRDNDPMDFHGHGTHVAGIAAAVTNNIVGIAGVSWKNKIMAVRAGYMNSTGQGELWWSDVAPAIVYGATNGAKIISMSFGGYGASSLLRSAVDYAYSKGAILVAAAGNDNVDERLYPAGYDNVIAVAATNSLDHKASFSNYGSWIDVSAPGVDIYSTMYGDTYDSWSGTSMSTPHVSGLAGLVISENPVLTNEEVKMVIRNTTDPIDSSKPLGTGRINVYRALLVARRIDITVENTSLSKTVICQNHSALIDLTVGNHGDFTETFNIVVYANTSVIYTQLNITLTSSSSRSIAFFWNTSSYHPPMGAPRGNYTITVIAEPIPGEMDVVNNNQTSGWVLVSIVGDITGPEDWPDDQCDMRDVGKVARVFEVDPAQTAWDPNCDITGEIAGLPDNEIDMHDVSLVAKHFGENHSQIF